MDTGKEPIDPKILNREVQAIWEENAVFWDEAMGEGNQFQRVLIAPATERLLALQPEEQVLDIACGNGVFSRRMAQLGAHVLACDFSQTFLELARLRTSEYIGRIEYRALDATNEDQLMALANPPEVPSQSDAGPRLFDAGMRLFDAAHCGMAIQDMTEIEPLFSSLARLLRPGGRFVFSIPHPAFNNSYIRKVVEEEDQEGELVTRYAIKVTGYIQASTDKGLGIIGQPAAHYYFHRPLSEIYNIAFRHGFMLDGIEEPVFGPEDQADRPFAWANYPEIPPVLVSRLRKVADS